MDETAWLSERFEDRRPTPRPSCRWNNLVRRYQDLTGRDVVDRTALLQLVP